MPKISPQRKAPNHAPDFRRYLNVGCGPRFKRGWTNIEQESYDPEVLAVDVGQGLPFAASSFELVYHSHFLEHLNRKEGRRFLGECFRVLENGGTLRVVVPDLEETTRDYLEALDRASKGEPGWRDNYEYMLTIFLGIIASEEMVPMMFQYLRQSNVPNLAYVKERTSQDVMNLVESPKPATSSSIWHKLSVRVRAAFKRRYLRVVLTKQEREALEVGMVRTAGHVHKWMYDRYSLPSLLSELGFTDIRQVNSRTSRILGWNDFCLDIRPDGSDHQKSSIYFEATKP